MKPPPAQLGGPPAFDPPLPFARPALEEKDKVLSLVETTLESGLLTNGPLVRSLEERAAHHFGVDHCVAVSSCTVGLMLVVQALDPVGAVAVPSFTFSATAHAVRWNHKQLAFIDCDPMTWVAGAEHVPSDISLILATHVSGVPCPVADLEARSRELGVPLVFDAAHAAGSLVPQDGSPVPLGRFGEAEVFSLTPTKVLSGAEGGLVTTNDSDLADTIRLARDYANPGNYDTQFAGINGRLSELHAALVLVAFDHLEERVAKRNSLADRYRSGLGEIPGVGWQQVPDGARSSNKDFIITIDAEEFGCHRDVVAAALRAEGIPTRPYYAPPVHRQHAYRDVRGPELPVTDHLADRVIALPIWSDMSAGQVDGVVEALERIHFHAPALGPAAAES